MAKDYCTGYFDGSWSYCCKMHDRRYANKRLNRSQADELLFRCVKRKSNIVNAYIMWAGVRLFGWHFYKKAKKEYNK